MDPRLLRALLSWDLGHRVTWLLPLAMLLYARGFWRVHLQMPQRYPGWRLAAFTAGLLVVFLAIASPLDALGELLLSFHMTQHMIMMMVAPPLILLGQPFVPMLRALPPRVAKRVLRPVLTATVLRRLGRVCTQPAACWTALTVAVSTWHLPRLYELGLHSDGWHEVQHACFFTAALFFWWPIIGVWPGRAMTPRWKSIPYLVGADLVNTALAAFLTFSTHVLYPTYEFVPRVSSLSALDDQALAGVLMWVPGSLAYLLPAVILTVRLFEPRPSVNRQPSRSWVCP
jgi:putative membrane protein